MTVASLVPRLLRAARRLSAAALGVASATAPAAVAQTAPVPAVSAQPGGLAAPADTLGVPHVRAARLGAGVRIRVDGRLDEAAWAEATVAGSFVQTEPTPGAPATERTEARVLADTDAIYVAVRCFVRDPATVVRRLRRRDVGPAGVIDADDVFVEIGSAGDSRTAFSFGVSAAGVQFDAVLSDDRDAGDYSWDAVWDSAVAPFSGPDGAGYTVEVRVPLSQLRYDPAAGRPWQVQFQRNVAATGERSYWAPILPSADGYVSRFGVLDGLDGLGAPRRVEVVPYASTRLTRASGDAADPFYDANALRPGLGLDAKIGLTAGLVLTATVNPDFGQVEADPALLNLSQFENRYEERRPFFVESQDLFAFGSTPAYVTTADRPTFFYSRRIGGTPSSFAALYADTSQVTTYLDAPDQTTIAGAAKVSGQVGGWTVGLLNASTTQEVARFLTVDGTRGALPVAPFANYAVARARRGWREGRTLVGAFASNVVRDTQADAFRAVLPSTATVGGLDVEVASASRAWTATGLVAASVVGGEPSVITALQRAPQRYFQRPDADHVELDPFQRSLSGYRAEASVAKTGGGRHWRGALTLGATSPGFETNDLGFQLRADFLTADLYAHYNEPAPGPAWLRAARLSAYANRGYTYGGERVYDRVTSVLRLVFSNLWNASVTASARPEQLNDRLTRGGPLAVRPSDGSLSGSLYTNSARRVSGGVTVQGRGEFAHGYQAVGREWTRTFSPYLAVRPTDAVEVSFEPLYLGARNTDQFLGRVAAPGLGIGGRRILFADTRIESLDLTLRADWAFSPTLTLQLVAVPSVFAVRFENFRELAAGRTYDFVRYGETRGSVAPVVYDADGNETPAGDAVPDAYAIDPGDGGDAFTVSNNDFTQLSLRGNAVLRWQWRPGSALFFVWQQVRDEVVPFSGYDVVADVPDVFSASVQNVFLLKATYWFGL